jgi:outer membrane lipoprotein-sorting protein
LGKRGRLREEKHFSKGFSSLKILSYQTLLKDGEFLEPHGKIVVSIDFSKGVIMKTEVYDPDEILIVKTEVKEVSLLGSIWLPIKYLETKFLDEVIMISEMKFYEIELNSGISDSEFES